MNGVCGSCSTTGANKRCSGCRGVYYCNIKCQRDHWKTHKRDCKKNQENIDEKIDMVETRNTNVLMNIAQKMEINTQYDPIDSNYLLNPNNSVYYDECSDDSQCTLGQCKSLQRITHNLRRYHKYVEHKQKLQSIHTDDGSDNKQDISNMCIDDIFGHSKNGSSSNVYLLNDFHHLMYKHGNEYGSVHKSLLDNCSDGMLCNVCDCLMIRRNYRNRRTETNIYFDAANNEDIIKQQLMDKIHSYYYHSFDLGYKMSADEHAKIVSKVPIDMKQNDDDEIKHSFDANVKAINTFIKTKRTEFEKSGDFMNRFNRYGNANKFKVNALNLNQYSFGIRFFYWDHYKNNTQTDDDVYYGSGSNFAASPDANYGYQLKDWYIVAKHGSFKEELTKNKLCRIDSSIWDRLHLLALAHVNTDKCRTIGYCSRDVTACCYDMIYGQLIRTDHLVAMMLYCNFDQLQQTFSTTFRYCDENESDISLKKRHSNYYYLAKNLRELVECFGMKWSLELESIRLYHGINGNFTFSTLDAFIKGPLSTTTSFMIAAQFCDNDGMILDVSIDPLEWVHKINETDEAFQRLNCMDCMWLSDYPVESELFFIGGLSKFTIDTIIESPGTNHCKYIHGLKQMTYFMSNGDQVWDYDNIPSSREQKQFVFRLLSHELSRYFPAHPWARSWETCPRYFQDLLHSHCANIKMIDFRNRGEQESRFHEALFKYDSDWIKLDLITTLFPNIRIIVYEAAKKDLSFLMQPIIYRSILNFIQDKTQNQGTETSPEIHIVINPSIARKIEKYIQRYTNHFKQCSYAIRVNIVENMFDGVNKMDDEIQPDARIVFEFKHQK
eukprot:466358_1